MPDITKCINQCAHNDDNDSLYIARSYSNICFFIYRSRFPMTIFLLLILGIQYVKVLECIAHKVNPLQI